MSIYTDKYSSLITFLRLYGFGMQVVISLNVLQKNKTDKYKNDNLNYRRF
jgi:hypothetical protein